MVPDYTRFQTEACGSDWFWMSAESWYVTNNIVHEDVEIYLNEYERSTRLPGLGISKILYSSNIGGNALV